MRAALAVALAAGAPALAEPWTAANHGRVDVSAAGDPTQLSYELWISPTGETRIHMAGEEPGKQHSRDMLLVAGRFLAVHGDALEPGYEIDALDAAALEWQLVAKLLDHAVPGGPPAGPTQIPIAVNEPKVPIEVSTASAAGSYPAPWSAAGQATRDSAGRVLYRIDFRFTPPAAKQPTPPTHLEGFWEILAPPPAIPDSFSLAGWKLYQLGPVKHQTPEGERQEYAATPLAGDAKTVGELRQRHPED